MKDAISTYPLTLLYDGACPICRWEMDRLARRDALRRLVFVDIASPGFDPLPYGVTLEGVQGLIHAVRKDGTVIVGVGVLRLAYAAIGIGLLFAPTQLPALRTWFDRAYALFARNRYAVSAALRPLLVRLAAREAGKRMKRACTGSVCKTPPERTAS